MYYFWSFLFWFALIYLTFYLFVGRPAKKQQDALDNMRNNLRIGDYVYTAGGVVGKVVKIDSNEVMMDVGNGQHNTYKKFAIMGIEQEPLQSTKMNNQSTSQEEE